MSPDKENRFLLSLTALIFAFLVIGSFWALRLLPDGQNQTGLSASYLSPTFSLTNFLLGN